MPLRPNNGLIDVPLRGRSDVAELVRVARQLDLSPKAFSLDHRRLADIWHHLFLLVSFFATVSDASYRHGT